MTSVAERSEHRNPFDIWDVEPGTARVIVADPFGELADPEPFEKWWLQKRAMSKRRFVFDHGRMFENSSDWAELDDEHVKRWARLLIAQNVRDALLAASEEHRSELVAARARQADAPSLVRIGGLAGLAVMFAAIPLLLASVGVGLTALYAGFGLFALANYAGYRVGERNYIIGPSVAAGLTAVSFLLGIIALIGTLDGVS